MPDFPAIVIGVITYARPTEIRATITALTQRIHYAGPVTLIVSDDSSPGAYCRDLEYWWSQTFPRHPWQFRTISTARNSGWGKATNGLLREAFDNEKADAIFQIEDDYIAHADINLSAGVALLQQEPTLGMVRYRATAGTPMLYYQRETDISAYCPEYHEYLGYTQGRMTWLELLPNSPTLWLYSNGAHLKKRDFHDLYGMYPEGLKLGQTEEAMAHLCKDTMLVHPIAPKIGIQPEFVYMRWDHVGVSYQHTEHDK